MYCNSVQTWCIRKMGETICEFWAGTLTAGYTCGFSGILFGSPKACRLSSAPNERVNTLLGLYINRVIFRWSQSKLDQQVIVMSGLQRAPWLRRSSTTFSHRWYFRVMKPTFLRPEASDIKWSMNGLINAFCATLCYQLTSLLTKCVLMKVLPVDNNVDHALKVSIWTVIRSSKFSSKNMHLKNVLCKMVVISCTS